jgi:hypothetical protein
MATIRLVQNDTGPQLRFSITDSLTGSATDLTGATVQLHFRAVNTSVALFTRNAIVIPPATAGVAVLQWQDGDLDIPAGEYEGEVEVTFTTGLRETIFNTLQFAVREEFA